MTCKTLEADSGVISLGMAVAPVTNWLYYDSIYTERYMSVPALNEQGYVRSAVNNVTAFGKVDFILAHGSGDDNVHYMNSASLVDKFTQEHVRGWRFRMFTDS
jgi:dipeptidyl aminopeptidase